MWLSEKATRRKRRAGGTALGTVSAAGGRCTVVFGSEHRGVRVLAPAGREWRPETDCEALVLETEDGERFLLGCPVPDEADPAGGVLLRCGETALRIGREGVSVTGRFVLNGTEIFADGEED